MMQTWAMIVDAYRELNTRKLFWATLGLSLLVIAAIGSLGINEKGPTVLWYQLPIEFITTQVLDKADFYKVLFINVGFNIWLSWAAMVLALISTANIIPDFVSGGAIELTLSKPISRLRLFLTKYCTALLFVGLQVSVFAVGAVLVIAVRGGGWEPRLLLAVPVIVLVFSYLYCVSTLVGMLTRSGMAALLVTGVVWLSIFTIHLAETPILLRIRTQYEVAQSVRDTERLARVDALKAAEKAVADAGEPPVPVDPDEQAKAGPPVPDGDADDGAASGPESAGRPDPGQPKPEAPAWQGMDELNRRDPTRERAAAVRIARKELKNLDERQADLDKTAADVRFYHAIAYAVKTVMPKTSESLELLSRNILAPDALDRVRDEGDSRRSNGPRQLRVGGMRVSARAVEDEIQRATRARTLTWIIGTSLLFEAVVLGAATLLFVRRDF